MHTHAAIVRSSTSSEVRKVHVAYNTFSLRCKSPWKRKQSSAADSPWGGTSRIKTDSRHVGHRTFWTPLGILILLIPPNPTYFLLCLFGASFCITKFSYLLLTVELYQLIRQGWENVIWRMHCWKISRALQTNHIVDLCVQSALKVTWAHLLQYHKLSLHGNCALNPASVEEGEGYWGADRRGRAG